MRIIAGTKKAHTTHARGATTPGRPRTAVRENCSTSSARRRRSVLGPVRPALGRSGSEALSHACGARRLRRGSTATRCAAIEATRQAPLEAVWTTRSPYSREADEEDTYFSSSSDPPEPTVRYDRSPRGGACRVAPIARTASAVELDEEARSAPRESARAQGPEPAYRSSTKAPSSGPRMLNTSRARVRVGRVSAPRGVDRVAPSSCRR